MKQENSVYLGLDLGTGSLKALLLSGAGEVLARESAPYQVSYPQPGWAESDPREWEAAAVTATRALPGELRAQVRAVSFSGQMHGVVLTDAALVPLRPAVLWLDARSVPLLPRFARLAGPRPNPVTAGMAGPTLLWVRGHEEAVYAAARWAFQPKDWLRARLGGDPAGDPSDASGTLLANVNGEWNLGLLRALGLRADLLPPLRASDEVVGTLSAGAASLLGLPEGVPLVTGAGDTAAALFGGGLGPDEAGLTVGSGAQIVRRLDVPRADPRLQLYRAAGPGWYALAAMQNAGLALEWARGVLGLSWEDAYAEAFAPSVTAPPAFLPYLSGERTPLMDPHACGSWSGLRLGQTRGDLMRAALEGVAFALRDGLDTLEEVHGRAGTVRVAGGGTVDPRWRQLLADALDRPLRPGEVPDASARGAALLALAGVGGSLADVAPVPLGPPVEPGRERDAVQERFARWKELQGALRAWWSVG
ncbi:FGGY family carbohydrate kinase [Deinococcus sp. YIM 134068]|uniref:xylulokinase n=1 Tax=Deinococcus lichenicola TaxID=3118910 RepID=UPI002F945035